MSAKKRGQSARQRAMSTRATERSRSAGYAYAFLLILETMLIGVNAENLIQQGDSPIEVLIWIVKESISLVKQASSLQEKQKKSLLPRHRRSEEQ